MQVEVISQTTLAERLVCQAARGDYYSGYIGDTEYKELMEPVDYEDRHVEDVSRRHPHPGLWKSIDDVPNNAVEKVELDAKTDALIERLFRRGHYGPFEHPSITFAVKGVSRVTMAQITRHRLMSFDVQSMRYVDFEDKEAITPKSLVDPEHASRETGEVELRAGDQEFFRTAYEKQCNASLEMYRELVDAGVPKEDARFVLPLGMPVNMTFSGNARTMLHVLDMRNKGDAQWEVREMSQRMLEELKNWMPKTFNYYEENGPNKLAP